VFLTSSPPLVVFSCPPVLAPSPLRSRISCLMPIFLDGNCLPFRQPKHSLAVPLLLPGNPAQPCHLCLPQDRVFPERSLTRRPCPSAKLFPLFPSPPPSGAYLLFVFFPLSYISLQSFSFFGQRSTLFGHLHELTSSYVRIPVWRVFFG